MRPALILSRPVSRRLTIVLVSFLALTTGRLWGQEARLPSASPLTPIVPPSPAAQLTAPAITAPPLTVPVIPERAAAGCPCLCGDSGSQFAIDALLGMQLGIRGQAAVYRTPENAFVLEAYYGLLLNKIGSGEGAGAGGRYYWRRTDSAGSNSVVFGPGAGIYYNFDDEYWMLAPTIDVAWVRAIGDNGAWQIGLNAGLGVGVASPNSDDVGRVTPLFSLFTGFRF